MTGVRARGEDIRRYILDNVEKYPTSISKVTAERFKITRQAVNKHLQRLTDEKILAESGNTRSRVYKLSALVEWRQSYELLVGSPAIAEDVVWTNDIRLALGQLPDNALNIWHHGFTEMFNNVIDHSGGSKVQVYVRKNAAETEMQISDNGVGIFKKIQSALQLLDERHAVLELAKGKFTTDPKNHTGEGIFFTSRMFDDFFIISGDVAFSHEFGKKEDWIQEPSNSHRGTHVFMKLHNHTSRTTKKVLDQFTSDEDFTFSKTVVPVSLAKYGDDNLISRSQAKRLLSRIELFKVVVFDFTNVPTIGQAFADEIFRVFAKEHPGIQLMQIHASSEVKRMIERVRTTVSSSELPAS
jgi:anti-sigma regulatory factor (Ser/Thr protein kinase)/biotin operon repressor